MRSIMSQERLNALALISIKNGFLDNIDYESVIDEFCYSYVVNSRHPF